ncbi:DUF2975 domain-containing protein [Nocardioides mesophilus]|uniref:DUF2975 domain-containing protein n=1 Tax=Nocardioides mesophilus TaxID=433659 RepID=A0A7G9RDW8_9ACTN|nr:DUF2975 domain-containing protein [Nocardioides mesophilus]QNN53793.1 DUF2975 domain-containing protein [Nocardioides mesophilus]
MTDLRADRALAQIDRLTWTLGAFVVALLLILVPLSVFGSGSLLGFGEPEVCATTRPGVVAFGGNDAPGEEVLGLREDARWSTATLHVCDTAPGLGTRLGGALGGAAELVLFLGSLFLTRRVIRRARRDGLFSSAVAGAVRVLGLFLVVGAPVSALLGALSTQLVLASAVRGMTWHDNLLAGDLPWTALIAGVGILSVARVLAFAHDLQDDVDGTV